MKKAGWQSHVAVVVVTAATVIAILIPAVRKARDDARRTQSKNNLKQIGLALYNYNYFSKQLPPGTIVDAEGEVFHSWMTPLLAHLEGKGSVDHLLDKQLPWNHPQNAPVFRRVLPCFVIPGVEETTDADGFGLSHYAASSQFIGPDRTLRLDDLPDDKADTVLAGEIGEGYRAWGGGLHVRDPALPLNSGPYSFGRYSRDGAFLLMGDGTVRFVSNAEYEVMRHGQRGTSGVRDSE